MKNFTQNINNNGAIIGSQVNFSNMESFDLDDIEYPNWLVPLDMAIKLKEIGFDFPTQNRTTIEILKSKRYKKENKIYATEHILKLNFYNANKSEKGLSVPTWEQTLEWFRNKGFYITLENHQDSTKFMFYNMKINEGKHFKGEFSSYEETREVLVKKLIEVYGNSI